MQITIPLELIQGTLFLIGGAGVLFGVFSFIWPNRSIQLYQDVMRYFKWHVEPLDLAREIKTTRRLGLVMLGLGVAIFVLTLTF